MRRLCAGERYPDRLPVTMRVLVVEDERPIREGLLDRLGPEGLVAEGARDGEEALAALAREAWGYGRVPETRTADFHIVRFRKKIEATPEAPRYLQTVHGAGYMLTIPEEE